MTCQNFCAKAFFLVALFSLTLPSCKNRHASGPEQGIIEYKLEVLENNNPVMSTDILPGTMTTRFKSNNMSQELSAGMGLFSTCFVSDYTNKSIAQTLTMLGKQYACKVDSNSMGAMLAKEPLMKFQFVEGSKRIAGYTCKKAVVTPTEGGEPFEVYYTDSIQVNNPNFYSYYAPVKGVLMDFQVTRYNIRMHLTAQQVKNQEVEDKYFDINSSAKMVTLDEMNSYFTGGK